MLLGLVYFVGGVTVGVLFKDKVVALVSKVKGMMGK
jgi:hypothetical protein